MTTITESTDFGNVDTAAVVAAAEAIGVDESIVVFAAGAGAITYQTITHNSIRVTGSWDNAWDDDWFTEEAGYTAEQLDEIEESLEASAYSFRHHNDPDNRRDDCERTTTSPGATAVSRRPSRCASCCGSTASGSTTP